MVKGHKGKTYEEWLRSPELFSLEKRMVTSLQPTTSSREAAESEMLTFSLW